MLRRLGSNFTGGKIPDSMHNPNECTGAMQFDLFNSIASYTSIRIKHLPMLLTQTPVHQRSTSCEQSPILGLTISFAVDRAGRSVPYWNLPSFTLVAAFKDKIPFKILTISRRKARRITLQSTGIHTVEPRSNYLLLPFTLCAFRTETTTLLLSLYAVAAVCTIDPR